MIYRLTVSLEWRSGAERVDNNKDTHRLCVNGHGYGCLMAIGLAGTVFNVGQGWHMSINNGGHACGNGYHGNYADFLQSGNGCGSDEPR